MLKHRNQLVSPFKDVEGLHFKFHYNLYHKCVLLIVVTGCLMTVCHFSIRYLEPKALLESVLPTTTAADVEQPPPGMVKSIIPCTSLAIVKCLEYVGVYNKLLPYGDRAYGKTITIINRYAIGTLRTSVHR